MSEVYIRDEYYQGDPPTGPAMQVKGIVRRWTFDNISTSNHARTLHISRRSHALAWVENDETGAQALIYIPDSTAESLFGGRAGQIHPNQLNAQTEREMAIEFSATHNLHNGISEALRTRINTPLPPTPAR